MKKFIGKVIFFFIFCLLVAVIPSYVIDPYNVFHWKNIRDNGVEPNKNYIKTKYILNNPDKFEGFLFGSSRVGTVHVEKISDMKIYNMTYSLGTPYEHYETLKSFVDAGVCIETVYMGVDSLSYTEDYRNHNTQGLRSSYQYLQQPSNFFSLYINPTMIVQSLPTILSGNGIDGIDYFYEYGWWCDYNCTVEMDWTEARAIIGTSYRLEETLQDVQNIKNLCDENNIELVVFTNPMCEITYRESLNIDYLNFLKRLADITDYYNFSGINDVTTDTDNYLDASHYNAYVGDMLIDVMVNDVVNVDLYNQGFGWYVTLENVNDLLDILQ